MKPSSRDHQLGLASPLNYVANQSGNIKSPSKKEAGLDVSHQALVSREGRGENCFLDIPFHRMSVMAMLRQLPKLAIIMKINLASRNAMPQQPNTP
jgi:hypothetical protein